MVFDSSRTAKNDEPIFRIKSWLCKPFCLPFNPILSLNLLFPDHRPNKKKSNRKMWIKECIHKRLELMSNMFINSSLKNCYWSDEWAHWCHTVKWGHYQNYFISGKIPIILDWKKGLLKFMRCM